MHTSKIDILIIDDSPVNSRLCSRILEKKGYTTHSCYTGEEAIEYLDTNNAPDLILLDIVMPGIDGYEFSKTIKKVPEIKNTPIIFLSSMDDEESIVKGFNCGGVDYITRPFRPLELLARTQTHIELKKAREKLLEMATTDELTCLMNRRYFIEKISEEYERLKRYNTPYTVIMIDIDHFKIINDTYGHGTGDIVLKSLSNNLKSSLRNSDLIGRIGGEEFAAILPETELDAGLYIAERIRNRIENTILFQEKGLKRTISLGVSQAKQSDSSAEIALERADKALYEAKKSGRNRICSSK